MAVAAVATIATPLQVSARHQDDSSDNVPPGTLAKLGDYRILSQVVQLLLYRTFCL